MDVDFNTFTFLKISGTNLWGYSLKLYRAFTVLLFHDFMTASKF